MHDRCPVTGGAATRMTRESFARTCAGKRSARRATGMWLEGGDWRFKRCATCKGRPENWPPELTIITMEATMTAKKTTKPANKTPETELLAKLQLEVQTREVELEGKEKQIDELVRKHEKTLERLAGMLGCQPGDLEQGMATMQGLVQEIRDVVEPEVADAHPENLAEACKCLVRRLHIAGEDAEQHQTRWEQANARVEEMTAELNDANARIAKLEDENREAWVALDGAGAGTLIEVAEMRWKEIETLRAQVSERDKTIKHLEGEIVELVEASALMPARGDDGQAENILRDLMRKIVDGRISLLHNA